MDEGHPAYGGCPFFLDGELIFYLDGLYRTVLGSLPSGFGHILWNLICFGASLIVRHLEDFRASIHADLTSDTSLFIHFYLHSSVSSPFPFPRFKLVFR